MSVSKMERLTVVVPQSRADALLVRLSRLRCVHLTDAPYEEEGLTSFAEHADVATAEERARRVDSVLPALTEHSAKKRRLFAPPVRVRRADFRTDGRMDLAWKVVEEAERILERRAALLAEREEKLNKIKLYTPYVSFDRPLDFEGTASTVMVLGAFPAKVSRNTVTDTLHGRAAMVQVINEDATGLYVVVLAHRSEQEQTLQALCEIGFTLAELPRVNSLVKIVLDETRRDLSDIEAKLTRGTRRLVSLAERLHEVQILSDVMHADLLTEQRKERLAATKQCVVCTGFCPTDAKDRVVRVLDSMDAAYEFTAPENPAEIPVYLRAPRAIKSFSRLNGAHICPVYAKFDPTILMTVLFCLLFGLMFADVGYGALLAVGAFLCLRFVRMPLVFKQLLSALLLCGVSSAVCGVLLGSYFGTLPALIFEDVPSLAILPESVCRVLSRLSAVNEPYAAALVAFLLGALHLAVGMVLHGIRLCRAHRATQALLDVLPCLVLLVGLALLPFFFLAGLITCLCGLIAIWVTQGRGEHSFPKWMLKGLRGFSVLLKYGVMLLGFTRVLALGIAGTALGAAFVGMFGNANAPFLPFLLAILVFAAACLILYVMDLILAAAHAKGLPYVDFLGRFHTSANPAFDPMTPSGRYTEDVTSADSNLL